MMEAQFYLPNTFSTVRRCATRHHPQQRRL